MSKTIPGPVDQDYRTSEHTCTTATDDQLRRLAFDNTVQANIITTVGNRKIIMANKAAVKLLGYSKKELLSKNWTTIFDINETSFKKMLKQRKTAGKSTALVTAIKKSDKEIACEITSALFVDETGIEKAITTIEDMSQSILIQKKIDNKKEKIVADNILLAQTKSDLIEAENNKRIRSLTERLESERADIVKELHENVNQLLCASRMYVAIAKHQKENNEIYLTRSSEYTLTAINEIKKLTKGLTADIVMHLGLFEAIEIIIQDIMAAAQIKISSSFETFEDQSVNEKFKLLIYRLIQDQLNNILKHADATEVKISLSQNKSFIILSLADNGVGFDINKKQKGVGIQNIKSQATSYFGITRIISQPGQGCVLKVKFPIRKELLNKAPN